MKKGKRQIMVAKILQAKLQIEQYKPQSGSG
jgi:hypothetical protein